MVKIERKATSPMLAKVLIDEALGIQNEYQRSQVKLLNATIEYYSCRSELLLAKRALKKTKNHSLSKKDVIMLAKIVTSNKKGGQA